MDLIKSICRYDIYLSKVFDQNNDLMELLKAENSTRQGRLANFNLSKIRPFIANLLLKIRVITLEAYAGTTRNPVVSLVETAYDQISFDINGNLGRRCPGRIVISNNFVCAGRGICLADLDSSKYTITYALTGVNYTFYEGLLDNTKYYLLKEKIWPSFNGKLAIPFN